ncbi:protein of unknown function DUF302 [Thermocrinis albus DSM 14484]|uniref:DUF302 domain-containing protein n=1 Tax=Thermocrinis albus (strain DSM 14484 / JCM 11386 / HI 11/12) TaxID=638303 RepID=D3SMM0_THEAH|nr:DUF302 domain-containing protein [Thermocrinis albus]ADC90000.1 protein of unknown function DUF302 [Thermocrinis albus DSM 14484]
MLINYETTKSVEDVVKVLEEKAKSLGFGVMAVHHVSQILSNKGVPIDYQCVIVEVCSPRHASQVLTKNPYISTAMPCRISVFQKDGKTVISTMAPTAMLEVFNEPELKPVAEEVEKLMKEILEAAV